MGLLDEPTIVPIPNKTHIRHLEAKANRILKPTKTRRGKRKKHKRKVPNMNYKQYMGSAYWKKRKLLYWSKYGKNCEICGKKEGVTLHHKRYDVKFGEEPNNSLVALCQFHHHEFHINNELKRNMESSTDKYVHEARTTHEQFIKSNIDDLSWIN